MVVVAVVLLLFIHHTEEENEERNERRKMKPSSPLFLITLPYARYSLALSNAFSYSEYDLHRDDVDHANREEEESVVTTKSRRR